MPGRAHAERDRGQSPVKRVRLTFGEWLEVASLPHVAGRPRRLEEARARWEQEWRPRQTWAACVFRRPKGTPLSMTGATSRLDEGSYSTLPVTIRIRYYLVDRGSQLGWRRHRRPPAHPSMSIGVDQ